MRDAKNQQPATSDQRRLTFPQRLATTDGIILLPFIGIISLMVILASFFLPDVVAILDKKTEHAEKQTLKAISDGVKLYVRRNRTWPPNLSALVPQYVPIEINQLSQNPHGYPRYFVAHPNTVSFNNGTGLATSSLVEARFLLISNLQADAAPTITNATQFDAWWTTVETNDLHIHKGHLAPEFPQVMLSATGTGGSFQIDGTTTSSSGGTLANYRQHHLVGTTVSLDEASTYANPEITFALTEDVTYTFVPCLPSGRRWVVPPVPPCRVLWISTSGNASGAPGIGSWTSTQVVSFVDPNLAYENGPTGTTNGTFGYIMDLEDFVGSADIDAGHYVGADFTVGGVLLQEGDLLLSTSSSENLNSLNSLSVEDEDVFIFRPSSPNDYSSGYFYMLIDGSDVSGDVGSLTEIEAVTLVEINTTVGDANLLQGDFLLSNHGDHDIWLFRPTSLGTSTSGALSLFIQGDDIEINQEWEGIEVIEVETQVGDVTLQAGQILGTLTADEQRVGDNQIPATRQDIFILDLTRTGSNTEGNATLWFDGSDVSLTGDGENIDMITLNGNGAGSLSAVALNITNPGFETGNLTGWSLTPDLSGRGGTNQWGVDTSDNHMSSPHRGTYFANGIENGATSDAVGGHITGVYQRIDISAYSTDIDAGGARVSISGYGHGQTNADQAVIRIEFYDQVSGGNQLGSMVESQEPTQSQTWTNLLINNESVPTGTRSVEILLLGKMISGAQSWNDTGFDDISGTLMLP